MRTLVCTATVTAVAATAIVLGSGTANALPAECTQQGSTVTCVYRHIQVDRIAGGLVPVPLQLPQHVWRVRITATGGDGGASSGGTVVAPGGRGAVASADLVLPPGALLWVSAGVDGFDRHCYDCAEHAVADDTNGGGGGWIARELGVPNNGGDGGAASTVEIDTGVRNPLAPNSVPIRWAMLVAGAGGGGASSASGVVSPGGDAGSRGHGIRGGGPGRSDPLAFMTPGGLGGSAEWNGNSAWGRPPGSDGWYLHGGNGGYGSMGDGPGLGGGGGGGGGWSGGGGGGAGGRYEVGDPNVPPGGGGGGSSLVPPGGTIALADADAEPGVIVTFEV